MSFDDIDKIFSGKLISADHASCAKLDRLVCEYRDSSCLKKSGNKDAGQRYLFYGF
jgi:hypothetical protein